MPLPFSDAYGTHSPYSYMHLMRAFARMDALFGQLINDDLQIAELAPLLQEVFDDLAKDLGIPLHRLLSVMAHTLEDPATGQSGRGEERGRHAL